MLSSHLQNNPLKFFFAIGLALAFGFTACTQGKGPGEEPSKVTTAGTEAAASDVCEKAENLNNILCQWVATEFSAVTPGGEYKAILAYNDQGRVTEVTNFDAGNKDSVHKITYNNYGISKIEALSSPDPAPSENFTLKTTTTWTYKSDGSVDFTDKQEEVLNVNVWTPNSTTHTSYDYTVPNKLIITAVDYDAANNPNSPKRSEITKDGAGIIQTIDEREGNWDAVNNTIDPVYSWNQYSYNYYPNGRMKTSTINYKSCPITTPPDPPSCDFTQAMVPEKITVTSVLLDDQDRFSAYSQTQDGGSGGANPTPDGVVDLRSECTAKYEIQTQAKIANKQHPFSAMVMISENAVGDLGFTDRDIFSTITCGSGGQSSTATFKWARLWEVLPNGKPPGSN